MPTASKPSAFQSVLMHRQQGKTVQALEPLDRPDISWKKSFFPKQFSVVRLTHLTWLSLTSLNYNVVVDADVFVDDMQWLYNHIFRHRCCPCPHQLSLLPSSLLPLHHLHLLCLAMPFLSARFLLSQFYVHCNISFLVAVLYLLLANCFSAREQTHYIHQYHECLAFDIKLVKRLTCMHQNSQKNSHPT